MDPEIYSSFNNTISHLIILQTIKNKNNQINNLAESIYFCCVTSVGHPKQLLRNCDEAKYFFENFRKSISYPLNIWKGVHFVSFEMICNSVVYTIQYNTILYDNNRKNFRYNFKESD